MNESLRKLEILRASSGLRNISFSPDGKIMFHYICSSLTPHLSWGSDFLSSEPYDNLEQAITREFELHLIGWRVSDDKIFSTRATLK